LILVIVYLVELDELLLLLGVHLHLELGLKLLLQLLLQLQLHLLMHPHLLDFIDELFRIYNFLVYHARSWVLLVHLLAVDCS
jgi:hypothetical protein